jgi:hypothetical protein
MTSTPKAFTKGDRVTIISNWDRKGTVVYRPGIVHSCGKKQMTIYCPVKGDEIGHHFQPKRAEGNVCGVHPAMSDEAAIAIALIAGADKKARSERAIAHYGYGEDHGYTKSVRRGIAELHEPRALSHEQAMVGIRAILDRRA